MLKLGLVLVAIPIGAHMVWEKLKSREDQIREMMHAKLSHRSDKSIIEVFPFLDDVLDMAFSLRAEGPMSSEMVKHSEDWIDFFNDELYVMGEPLLTVQESDNITFTVDMVKLNYSHQISECGLRRLLSVATCAKFYQMRPEISLGP